MRNIFLVATAIISLSLTAETTMTSLTCVKTTDGYPTERMMLEKTDAGYKLMHQTMGQKFFEGTNKTVAADMTCQFAPANKRLLACTSTNTDNPLYLSSKFVTETSLNDFFGMMTTEKMSFMEFDMHRAGTDGMTSETLRFALSSCRVKTDKTTE